MSVVPTIVEIKSMKSIMLLCKRVLNPNHIGVKYTLVSSGGGSHVSLLQVLTQELKKIYLHMTGLIWINRMLLGYEKKCFMGGVLAMHHFHALFFLFMCKENKANSIYKLKYVISVQILFFLDRGYQDSNKPSTLFLIESLSVATIVMFLCF